MPLNRMSITGEHQRDTVKKICKIVRLGALNMKSLVHMWAICFLLSICLFYSFLGGMYTNSGICSAMGIYYKEECFQWYLITIHFQ